MYIWGSLLDILCGLKKINMKQLLLYGNISLVSMLWYMSGMFELLAKEEKTTIDILIPTITLGNYWSYLIILDFGCSTDIVFRKEIKIRPIIIRKPEFPVVFSLVGKILGKSQFIWFNNGCEKVISRVQIVLIQIFFIALHNPQCFTIFNYYVADLWMKICSDHRICPRHAYFGRSQALLYHILILMHLFECSTLDWFFLM